MAEIPTIVISLEPFGCGFDVLVLPAPFGVGHDAEFSDHAEAVAYALRLQKAMGWRVRDLCEEEARP